MYNLKSIEDLTDSFSLFPGVGSKSAERMAFSVLDLDNDSILQMIKSLQKVKNTIVRCEICKMYSEENVCSICSNKNRDNNKIMVVSYPKDVFAFEKLNSYHGKYHVLHGDLSASRGIGYDDLEIDSLLKRITNSDIEIILATNPTIEGETTALYLAKILKPYNITVTRLAYGLPMGGNLEYADSLTLEKSFAGRKKYN